MRAAIVIPWRSQPSRVRAFDELCIFFKTHFPYFDLIISDSESDTFNRSMARNLGAKKAAELGADVIVFHDADFFVDPKFLLRAVGLSHKLQEVVIPYSLYCEHTEKKETDDFFKEMNFNNSFSCCRSAPRILESGLPSDLFPCAGSVVFPINIFQELGGYEEKISEWGPEDQLLHRRYFDKYNKLFTYLPGTGHSTYNDPSVRKNLFEKYQEFYNLIYFKDKGL